MTLADLRRTTGAALCTACAKCSGGCPLDGTAGFSPHRMVLTTDTDLPTQAAAAQQCLTCALCELRCPQGVQIADFARGLRPSVPAAVRTPCPHGRALQAAAELGLGADAPPRDMSWLDDDLRVAEEGGLALFVGCLPLFDALFADLGVRTTDIARAAIRILNSFDIEPVIVAEELCCGHDLLWEGEDAAFTALAEANAAAFAARGVQQIVTTCAECCRTWRLDYPDAVPESRIQVQHISEYLDDRLASGDLAWEGTPAAITYQDPCRLGRQLDVVAAPRRVLEAAPGVTLSEMRRSGADAQCCGTAGFIHCDAASRRLQQERLDEASATGAETLVTACPKCLLHFACAQDEDRRRGMVPAAIAVEDFTVLLSRALVGADYAVAQERMGAMT